MSIKKIIEGLPTNVSNFGDVANIFYDKTDQRYHYEDEHLELVFEEGMWKEANESCSNNGGDSLENNDSANSKVPNNNKHIESKKNSRPRQIEDDEKTNAMQLRLRKKQKLNEIKQLEKSYRQTNNRKNNCIYVSGLPLDVTSEELEAIFGKYGILAEDLTSGKKRIKLYKDDTGGFKGDALICYFKPESVELAISLLDGTSLRAGDETKIKVEQAKFNNKSVSENSMSNKHSIDEKNLKRKTRIKKKLSGMLNDWDDDELIKADLKKKYLKRYEKTVVLENCFNPNANGSDSEYIQEIEEDMESECSKFGTVLRIIICDKEEKGTILIKFKEKASADFCVKMLDGRYFDGAQLHAFIHDGKPYKISQKGHKDGTDDDDERRLREYEEFLEK